MTADLDVDRVRAFGGAVAFGGTASDYATHRQGFPPAFFDALGARGLTGAGVRALDIGTGTGTVARGLALSGAQVSAIDPAPALMEQAETLDRAAGVSVAYLTAGAESLPFDDDSFDLAVAGQCWHWFDRPVAAAEAARVLRPGGALVIAHFDWLPLPGSVVALTEELILRHNPDWAMAGGTGIYPQWPGDMAAAGFAGIETFSFDVTARYTHDGWRGRIRASAGVAASLSEAGVADFDAAHAAALATAFPGDPLEVPHRVWAAVGRLPG